MRKLPLIGLIAFAAAGCSDALTFDHQSTLYRSTRGVALHDADLGGMGLAQVGMSGTTCEVDTEWASIGTDYDYPGTDESVEDNGNQDGGKVVLIKSEDAVHIQSGSMFAPSSDYIVPGVQQGRLLDVGAVAYGEEGGDCYVEWLGTTVPARTDLGAGSCTAINDMTADPTIGTAIFGTDYGVLSVDPGEAGVVVNEEPTDLIEFDPVTGLVYAAQIGSTEVRGLHPDGLLVWTTDVGGSVIALDDMGSRGAVAVSVDDGASGRIVVLDGYTGVMENDVYTPAPADSVKVAGDGRTMALVNSDQVNFYKIGTASEAWLSGADELDSDWGLGDDEWDW